MKREELQPGTRVVVLANVSSSYAGRVGSVLKVNQSTASVDFDSPPAGWPSRQRFPFWLLQPAPRVQLLVAALSVAGPPDVCRNALAAFESTFGRSDGTAEGGRS